MRTFLRLQFFALVIALGAGLASCDNVGPKSDALLSNGTPTKVSGQVVFREKGGGFYGILTDNGAQLEPINLDAKYKTDGARVILVGKLDSSRLGVHGWGNPVEISSVRAQ